MARAERQHPPTAEDEVARLFAQHSERLLRYCLGWFHSRSDAEDAVQTTFLHALRALRRGVVPDSESAWLVAIAKNVCRAQVRAHGRRPTALDPELGRFASIERELEDHELFRALKVALAEIPEAQRRALVLKEWGGLSPSEIAAQLDISTSATYALLTRARRSVLRVLTSLPQQVALGLAALVYRLRSAVNGPLGGSAAKTVAIGGVVAAVAVGGISAEIRVEERRAPGPSSVTSSEEAKSSGGDQGAPGKRSRPQQLDYTELLFMRDGLAGGRGGTMQPHVPEVPIPGEQPEPVGPGREETPGMSQPTIPDTLHEATSTEEPLAELPLELALPDVPLPEKELPTVELPTVELPPPPAVGDAGDVLPEPDLGVGEVLPGPSTP